MKITFIENIVFSSRKKTYILNEPRKYIYIFLTLRQFSIVLKIDEYYVLKPSAKWIQKLTHSP